MQLGTCVTVTGGRHDGVKGVIVKVTCNGWYRLRDQHGGMLTVRGRDRLSVPVADLYSRYTKVTRSQAAAIRRDSIVARIDDDLPNVHRGSIRVVVSNKRGELEYQNLSDSRTTRASQCELRDLLESEHFATAWNYVTHRDNSRLWGLNKSTRHVVYMAVMPLIDTLDTRHTANGHTLMHSTKDQAYVGIARHGVAHRWCGYIYNHVRSANEVSAPSLVDATMRLHCAAGGIVWLFVVQHNLDLPLRSEEQRLIHYFGTHGERGMNATK